MDDGGVKERSTIQLIQLRGGSGVAPDCGMGKVAKIFANVNLAWGKM